MIPLFSEDYGHESEFLCRKNPWFRMRTRKGLEAFFNVLLRQTKQHSEDLRNKVLALIHYSPKFGRQECYNANHLHYTCSYANYMQTNSSIRRNTPPVCSNHFVY